MPRKKLIYTDQFPYHVWARSNNKEWFYVSKDKLWEIFISCLTELSLKYQFQVHAFVLMDNHYHLIASASSLYDLAFIMQRLQLSVSRKVNKISGRINHVFGGPYKASLIMHPSYFDHCLKYIIRNPVRAGLCTRIEDYKYSCSFLDEKNNDMSLTTPLIAKSLLNEELDLFNWLNEDYSEEMGMKIKTALTRTVFKLKNRNSRKSEI